MIYTREATETELALLRGETIVTPISENFVLKVRKVRKQVSA